jgi:type II secretory pathway pseudopilin PulG
MRSGKSPRLARLRGFVLLLPLLAVALIAGVSAHSLQLASQISRRSAEQQLLFVGTEFEKALLGYAGLGGISGPTTLEDLLKDSRHPGIRRHLRRIYEDPMSGGSEWGLIRDPAGRIVGIYSLAAGTPIQQKGFANGYEHFEAADSYAQWVFGLPAAKRKPITSSSSNGKSS